MKCPKCNNKKEFEEAASLKRIVVGAPDSRYSPDKIDPYNTEEFEHRTIYIRCTKCGYRQFGDKANKEFDLPPRELKEFNYSVTQKEVTETLKELAEEGGAGEIKLALEKGWKPTLDELWECVTDHDFELYWEGKDLDDYYMNDISKLNTLIPELLTGEADWYLKQLEKEVTKHID